MTVSQERPIALQIIISEGKMQKTELYSAKTEADQDHVNPVLSLTQFERIYQDWLFEGECLNHSLNTIKGKRDVCQKLIWFLRQRNLDECGISEIRQFIAYVRNGHLEPGGRWGNPRLTKPASARTIKYYFVYLDGLFRWAVKEEQLQRSPMERLKAPTVPAVNVQPFTGEQLKVLQKAAKQSKNPRRDEAIILLLLDTGMRASEICNLRMSDLDMEGRKATVLGKGNKFRTVFFGSSANRALWQYLREKSRDKDDPVFISDRGDKAGECFTRSGLLQLMERLGAAAELQNVRCSPHTFRHTFAVAFLRNGGNSFTLQQMLGHTDLKMTARYVRLAQADIENQHRQFSPADRLRRDAW